MIIDFFFHLDAFQTVSKTRSADMSGSSGSSNEVFTSVDEAVASGVVGCRKTRL